VKQGLPPDIPQTLQKKKIQYPNIDISHLSNDDLWDIARGLDIQKRSEILGVPPETTQIHTPLIDIQTLQIKWREICRKLLNQSKGLTTNALTTRNGVRFQLDEIFIPLGVVEKVERSKHSQEDGSPEKGSVLYEEKTTPISQSDFFEQVLRQQLRILTEITCATMASQIE
jgi:hypothetical protein